MACETVGPTPTEAPTTACHASHIHVPSCMRLHLPFNPSNATGRAPGGDGPEPGGGADGRRGGRADDGAHRGEPAGAPEGMRLCDARESGWVGVWDGMEWLGADDSHKHPNTLTHIHTHAQIDRHSLPVFRSRSFSLPHTSTPTQMVQYLLAQGAAVDQSGALGRTALYWACNQVGVLERAYMCVGGYQCACAYRRPCCMYGGCWGKEGYPPGLTPLHCNHHHQHQGQWEVASVLLSKGADPSRADVQGKTPLLTAAAQVQGSVCTCMNTYM